VRRLGVAVWGLGRHGVGRILPAIQESTALDLRGVCSRNHERVASVAATAGCRGWTDPQAMLRDPGVDAVYVATPTGVHAEHGRAVLEAGKHFWGEKPFTTTGVATQALLAESRARALTVGEALMYLYHPQFRQLCGYINTGRLGQVRSVCCQFGIPPLDFQSFRTEPAMGGGALLDVGCYTISAVHGLFPDIEAQVRYAAMGVTGDHAVDTEGQALLVLSNGVEAHLEWRTNCSYVNQMSVWGTAGTVMTDKIFSKPPTYEPVFHLRDIRGAETTEPGHPGNHFQAMFESFAAMVSSQELAEAERRRIAWRSDVLDQIMATAAARPTEREEQ
jgi:NDP-hexose-3-ketoreductase